MESYSYSYEGSPITSIISLVLVIIAIVGMWKVFSKAGVPGWHSIIPILNVYDLCKIALAYVLTLILRDRLRAMHIL